ncbi:MAG: hypothetical protein ACRCXH_10935 [Shewanella sp.]
MNFHKDNLEALQKFQQMLNAEPDAAGVESTPDKKAQTLVISHVETTLDELFFGHWRTENFKWSTIANEVQASLELVVIHPISGYELRRVGAASVIIMVDRVPDGVTGIERNRWALNPDNKKANAMDLAFGKLKAECLKNAALSLGKVFGRDLNRKNKDTYKPFKLKGALGRGHEQDVAYVRELIQQATDLTQLLKIYKACSPEVLAEVGDELNAKKEQYGISE